MDALSTDAGQTLEGGAGYRAEVLPPEAWADLAGPLSVADAQLNPEHAIVVAVRAPDGTPVARWVALNTVHLEGLLILPTYRKNPAVAGKLFIAMVEALRDAGVVEVVTVTQSPEVAALAAEAGFTPIPGTLWKLVL